MNFNVSEGEKPLGVLQGPWQMLPGEQAIVTQDGYYDVVTVTARDGWRPLQTNLSFLAPGEKKEAPLTHAVTQAHVVYSVTSQ